MEQTPIDIQEIANRSYPQIVRPSNGMIMTKEGKIDFILGAELERTNTLEFPEWFDRNGYRSIGQVHGKSVWARNNNLEEYTIEQLFQLFLDSKSK